MKKIVMLACTSMFMVSTAFAADTLHNTQWKTIDDETGKPRALVEFKQEANGTLTGTIKKTLAADAAKICTECKGPLKGKPVEGLVIVQNLKSEGNNKYSEGKILNPKNGKTYSLKGTLTNNGQKLELLGYPAGVTFVGRKQTWVRVQ